MASFLGGDEREEVKEKGSHASMTWVFEESEGETRYNLTHAHVFSSNIEFCGCHLPGLDTVYVQSFAPADFRSEDLVIGDEVIGFEEEPLHPGTDAVQLKQMVTERLASAQVGSDPPMIHLRRHVGGIDAKTPSHHQNPNLIFHYAKEYPDSNASNTRRPFVFAADKQLLAKADSHLSGMITYHEVDNAQLAAKLEMLVPETGDVALGKARSKATEAIRIHHEHTFLKAYVELMRERKKLHTEVLNINRSALHGLKYEKKKADLLEQLAECEAQICELIDIRLQQFQNYSDYDFRQELVHLKAEKAKLLAEHEAIKADLDAKGIVEKKKAAVAKIKAYTNLESFSVRDKYDMMEKIHQKEFELDGIFEDSEYQNNDDERFPNQAEFWTKVNSKKDGLSLTD